MSARSSASALSRSAARLHLAAAATGLIGLAVVAAAIGEALTRVDVGRRAAAFRLFGVELTAPSLNVPGLVLLVLAAAGVGMVLAGLRSAWRLGRAQRSLLRSLHAAGARGEHPIVFADARPMAFCAGYLRPRVYLSDGALAQCSEEELRAVLAHEEEHRRRRDPLRQACAWVLCDALFFLPVLRALCDRSEALAELLADDAALAASGGDPAPLAAAMLTFGTGHQGTAVGIAPERVDYLMGRPLSWRAPVLLATSSAVALLSLALLTWQLGRHALLETTLNLPLLSSQPCVIVLATFPLAATAAALWLVSRRA